MVREGLVPALMDVSPPEPIPTEHSQAVLIVDDDARLRGTLGAVLTPLGCAVVEAGSGEEALTVLLQREVAVIVLDKNMPGMDGFETAQLIRGAAEQAATPIIFLTGQADAGDLDRGYDLGAVDFLVKPVTRGVLYAKVKALLELDRSFARLRSEAAELHERQLQAARAAEIRQRDELAFTRRRARLANIFAEDSLDLRTLEKTIVTELSQLFDAECLLRLPVIGDGWHDSFADTSAGGPSASTRAWLVEQLEQPSRAAPRAVMVEELTARGEPVGSLCVGRPDGRPFTEVEIALLRGVAVAAALAISNASLYRVQAEYAAVMQATGDAILAVDASGTIRSCNRAATAMFGDGLIGRSIAQFAVDDHSHRLRERLDVTVATHRDVSLEITVASGGGQTVEVAVTLSPIGGSDDLSVAVVVHDLTEIKQAQQVISHLASHDPLTDLANRRRLTERLADLTRRQDGPTGLAALLYLDVNKFKAVNDTYGHDAGDELLAEVASRLRSAAGPNALVCRIGGDEFVVVFEDLPSPDAVVAAGNRILREVHADPVHCTNATLYPSLSMGASCLGAGANTAEELLSQADTAMFHAKRNHSDACVLYTDLMRARAASPVSATEAR
jgi:diguanylate cyclase (GGDEF)-like protein/PAS domain S-box-containing protein